MPKPSSILHMGLPISSPPSVFTSMAPLLTNTWIQSHSVRIIVLTAVVRKARPCIRHMRLAPPTATSCVLDTEEDVADDTTTYHHIGVPSSNFSTIPKHPLSGEGTSKPTETPLQLAARLQHVADDYQRMLLLLLLPTMWDSTPLPELLNVQNSIDDQIPEEEEKEVHYHTAPHQMAASNLRDVCLHAAPLREIQSAESSQLTRWETAVVRL